MKFNNKFLQNLAYGILIFLVCFVIIYTLNYKANLIQQILEEEVKPFPAQDGGDIDLYDIEGDLVKVVLKGACDACPSSTATLKLAIEARLKDRVDPELTVIAV